MANYTFNTIHKIGGGISTIKSIVDLLQTNILNTEEKKQKGYDNIQNTCKNLLKLIKEYDEYYNRI